jgi:hypothetical protein
MHETKSGLYNQLRLVVILVVLTDKNLSLAYLLASYWQRRSQSEEPNLKSLLLKQAFAFLRSVKLPGGGFALPGLVNPNLAKSDNQSPLLLAPSPDV